MATAANPTPTDPTGADRALLISEGRRLAATGAGRMIRQAADLTLAEIGAACQTDAAAVYRWEIGEHRPTGDFAMRYALVLQRLRDQHAPRARAR